MSSISGVIQKVFPRKVGNKTYYSIAIQGQDGFFGLGNIPKPTFVEEGNSVSFDYYTNQRGYLEITKGTLTEVQSATPAKSGGGSYTANADSRQVSIVSQVAYKMAADLVASGVSSGHLKLPPKTAYVDFVSTQVNQLAQALLVEMFNFASVDLEEAQEILAMNGFGAPADNAGMPFEPNDEEGME